MRKCESHTHHLATSISLPHSGKEVKDSVIISFIIGVWLLQLYNLMIIVVNIVICFVGHLFCQVYYKSHFVNQFTLAALKCIGDVWSVSSELLLSLKEMGVPLAQGW